MMRLKITVSACALAVIAAVSSGCRSEPIDYETAMNLVKDRNTEPVQLTFSAWPPAHAGSRPLCPTVADAYARLMDAHLITCTTTAALGKIYQPGPAGDALTRAGSGELAIIAGRWVPLAITSISRSVGNSVTAEVRLRFEPSPLYHDFESAFDAIQLRAGQSSIESQKQGKVVQAVFQRYQDGWHLQGLS